MQKNSRKLCRCSTLKERKYNSAHLIKAASSDFFPKITVSKGIKRVTQCGEAWQTLLGPGDQGQHQQWSITHAYDMWYVEMAHSLYGLLPQTQNLHRIMRKTAVKFQYRDILQNTWLVPFKAVKVTKSWENIIAKRNLRHIRLTIV